MLLVEDEDGLRRLAKRILEHAGYRVLEARDGNEAERVFALQGDCIDLLVTDVIMPSCGGPELLGRLRIHAPTLRALYMSGLPDIQAAPLTPVGSEIPFVQKPFTSAEFARQVRRALDG